MILFKSCPKCTNGDLMTSQDMFGAYIECVQCGYLKDLAPPEKVTAPAPVVQPVDAFFDPPLLSA